MHGLQGVSSQVKQTHACSEEEEGKRAAAAGGGLREVRFRSMASEQKKKLGKINPLQTNKMSWSLLGELPKHIWSQVTFLSVHFSPHPPVFIPASVRPVIAICHVILFVCRLTTCH